MGRDKTGPAEPWLTADGRLGEARSCGQGRAKGVRLLCQPVPLPGSTPVLISASLGMERKETSKSDRAVAAAGEHSNYVVSLTSGMGTQVPFPDNPRD